MVVGYFLPRVIAGIFTAVSFEDKFFKSLFILVGIVVFEYFNRVFYQITITKFIEKFLQTIRMHSFTNWIGAYECYEENKKKQKETFPLGEVISRLLNDTESIIELVSSGSFSVFADVLLILFSFIGFIQLNFNAGIFIVSLEVIFALFLIYITKFMAKIYMEVRDGNALVTRILTNTLKGVRQAYFTANNRFTSNEPKQSLENFLKVQLRSNFWDASYYSFSESLYPIFLIFLVIIFPYSRMTEMAVLAAVIDLIQRSMSPIKDVASKISNIQRAKSGIVRILQFNAALEAKERFTDLTETTENPTRMKVMIPEFCYHEHRDQFKLKEIFFEVNVNEHIALVGQSGSGKSTVLNIMAGNILCESGSVSIFLNDHKIILNQQHRSNLYAYKNLVSLVSQDSHLFTETLAFNLSFEEEIGKTIEDFWKQACLQVPYLLSWGVKLTDVVSPQNVSLGQKQLIACLRACYLKKPIVIFDEISSSLDSELESSLKILVKWVQRQAMTITVAHRLETIIASDKIYVLSKGNMVANGTHEMLLAHSPDYQELYRELMIKK